MYQKVATDLNFVDREKEVEKFWEGQSHFREEHGKPQGRIYLYLL